MENFSPTGDDGFCLEDWIDSETVATATDPSNASSPFNANTWDTNAIATMAPSEQTGLYDASPSLSYQHSTDNSLRHALGGSDKLENKDTKLLSEDQTSPYLDQQGPNTFILSTAFQAAPVSSNCPSNRPMPDIMLVSSDAVVFYVDQQTLLNLSTNSFDSLLSITPAHETEHPIHLPQIHSSELNILLHVLYELDCAQYNPSLPSILYSIDLFPQFGLSPKVLIRPQTPIYKVLLSQAFLYPLEVYCLCGKHDIYELATPVSSRLLSLALSTLTDKDAERMGSVYLARLFKLHRTRVQTLLRLLMPAPCLHNPTNKCGFEQQKALANAWTMTTAYLSWAAKPDISTSTIRAIFNAMMTHITCPDCLKGRDERLNQIIVNWSITKNTI